jgi:predicted cupin superfamily sugar epimerase
MAPGFDYADFVKANRDELAGRYPQHARMIAEFVR